MLCSLTENGESIYTYPHMHPHMHHHNVCRLYTSPKLCLTPVQKQQSPLQWLSEGHTSRLGEVPSLNEIRKTLVFNIDEAETISKAGEHQ